MRELLEYQADRIEAVLTKHEAPGRVEGGALTPRWIRFQVVPATGARIPTIEGLAEELAAALDAPEVRVAWRGAAVQVEVLREDPRPVLLLPLLRGLRNVPPVTAVLGVDDEGAPLMVRLPSPDVGHVLVAGATGAGKTNLLRAIALSLALRHPRGKEEIGLVLVGQEFANLSALPHLARPVVSGLADGVEAVASLARLLEQREERGETRPPVVLVVDGLTTLLIAGRRRAREPLEQLLEDGREAGIHVVASTAKPTRLAGLLGDGFFPVRVVGRVTGAEEARVASGWRGTGAERLLGQGDCVAVAEGRLFRFQAAYFSPQEAAEVASALGSDGAVALPEQVEEVGRC